MSNTVPSTAPKVTNTDQTKLQGREGQGMPEGHWALLFSGSKPDVVAES